jgi:lambda family phage portal protein
MQQPPARSPLMRLALAAGQRLGFVAPSPAAPARQAVGHQGGQRRSYAAAQINRLTEGWTTSSLSANADIHASLDSLRARSRQLFRDDPYARKFGQLVTTNVVGAQGFGLQARVYDPGGKPDGDANAAIEAAWKRWTTRTGGQSMCDASGRQSLRDMLRTGILTAARDGEGLIRYVRGNDAANPFKLALQMLDVDRIDTQLNRAPEMGHGQIRMGIEVNVYGRPTFVWLRNRHPGEVYAAPGELQGGTHVRVPAGDLVHYFIADRPEQFRGVPWMHAAMLRINNLGGYEEAAIVASRVGASKMGFFSGPDGSDAGTLADSEDAGLGELYAEAEAGTFGTLPPGTTFTPFNPDYPSQMFGEFVKANLRGIASGLGVAYHALANDLEGVNFSSIRSGTLEERDQWTMIQEWFIEAVLEPVYAEWLAYALSFGQITLPNGSALPLAKKDKFAGHLWQGRRWEWVDPVRDIQADVVAIDAELQSPQRVAAKLGRDYEDLLDELAQARLARDRAGLPPKAAKPGANQTPGNNTP